MILNNKIIYIFVTLIANKNNLNMVTENLKLSVEVKCPQCGRHLDKCYVMGEVAMSRKCKNCKNNIFTKIVDNKIVINAIDTKENAKDILQPNRFRSSQRANTKP